MEKWRKVEDRLKKAGYRLIMNEDLEGWPDIVAVNRDGDIRFVQIEGEDKPPKGTPKWLLELIEVMRDGK